MPADEARRLLLGMHFCSLAAGCSIKRMAVNKIGDALAGGATTFASDDDPELVNAAAPFSLKLMESLLAESPNHKSLLFATASGFTQYAFRTKWSSRPRTRSGRKGCSCLA